MISGRIRKFATHCVLVIAALATIATSRQTFSETDTLDVVVNDVVHVRVIYSEAAIREADTLSIYFTPKRGERSVMIIPDDPAIPPSVAPDIIDANDQCAETGPCEVGFSLDPGDGLGETVVEVTATAETQDGELSAAVTVEVLLD